MKIAKTRITNFLGLMTQYDSSQVPLGGAMALRNVAMLEEGRLRKIPGITALNNAPDDMSTQIPLLFVASFSGTEYTFSISLNASARNIINHTSDAVVTGGTAPSGSFGQPWTHTFYAQKHIVAGGDNHPYEITAATTKIDLVGTDVPHGNLVQSYLDRLYISDISTEEGIVRYSGTLDFVFGASNLVNTKEIPGKITALAVLSIGTDVAGIDTYLVICKRNAIWLWNETSKDIISQSIGTESPHTWVNTQIGPLFLGKDGNRNSVFYIPNGSTGEPKDIGRALHDLLNGSSMLYNPVLAYAVEDKGFYKLTFACTGHTTNNHYEVWLDLLRMAATGDVVWYGPHARGDIDAMVRTSTRLEMVRRAGSGVNCWFQENSDTTTGFTDMDGTTLTSYIDLPLNAPPLDEEKIFDVMELQVAKEANVVDNAVAIEIYAENVSQGSTSQSIYDSNTRGISRPIIPLYTTGTTGRAAKDSRIQITHSLNKRFDILGATIQYLHNEEPGGRVKSRI